MLRRCACRLSSAGSGPFDPYKILGVAPNASMAEVKKAYRRLALRFHPDSGPEGDNARFAAVNEAYEALKSGKWQSRPHTTTASDAASQEGGAGWDPKMRMYVYEQPGSTTEGYVSGSTRAAMFAFMILCFTFVFFRLFVLRVKHAPDVEQGSRPGQTTEGGSAGVAANVSDSSVHAERDYDLNWSSVALENTPQEVLSASTPVTADHDPLSRMPTRR